MFEEYKSLIIKHYTLLDGQVLPAHAVAWLALPLYLAVALGLGSYMLFARWEGLTTLQHAPSWLAVIVVLAGAWVLVVNMWVNQLRFTNNTLFNYTLYIVLWSILWSIVAYKFADDSYKYALIGLFWLMGVTSFVGGGAIELHLKNQSKQAN